MLNINTYGIPGKTKRDLFIYSSVSLWQGREGGSLSAEENEYRLARGMLWRTWFGEWVEAARYLSVRQLIQPMTSVGTFEDKSGGTHARLHEDLKIAGEGDGDRDVGVEVRYNARYLIQRAY